MGFLTGVFRCALIGVPLAVVAVVSAPEWPARAMMLDEPMREPVLQVAQAWETRTAPVRERFHATEAASADGPVVVSAAIAPISSGTTVAAAPVVAHVPAPSVVKAAVPTSGTVLLLGDSLMGGMVPGFRQEMDRAFVLKDKHRSSTGLTNRDYYNWPQEAGNFARAEGAQLVFIHLGGNDGQDMTVNGAWYKFGSAQWSQTYQKRAEEMIENVQKALPSATIVWIGLPAMRPEKYNSKMAVISSLQKNAAVARGVAYVDGYEAMGAVYSKDGATVEGARKILRLDDGIHYSREGGRMIAHTALKHLK